jgi:hypothetical protein
MHVNAVREASTSPLGSSRKVSEASAEHHGDTDSGGDGLPLDAHADSDPAPPNDAGSHVKSTLVTVRDADGGPHEGARRCLAEPPRRRELLAAAGIPVVDLGGPAGAAQAAGTDDLAASMQELREAILDRCGFLGVRSVSQCRRRRSRGTTYRYAAVLALTVDGLPCTSLEQDMLRDLAHIFITSGLLPSFRQGRLYVTNAEGTCVVNLQLCPSRQG